MTTAEIINQMEKEFDEKFPEMWGSNDGREGYDTDIKETVIDFFSSNLRTLLESFGEEIINRLEEDVKVVIESEVVKEGNVTNECISGVFGNERLKVKEIISSIGK